MKTVCPPAKCTGCRVCESLCPKSAIKNIDTLETVYEEIDEEVCIKCGLCEKVCPIHNQTEKVYPIRWYQGWAKESNVRRTSSSGGIAAAITQAFIAEGGYVCSCCFEKGSFSFFVTNNEEKAKKFAGSKYVKTSPYDVYVEIRQLLEEGNRLLFIGLPCQVAALKNYIPIPRQNKLYCIDLICHGTPSQKLLNVFLNQHHVNTNQLEELSFRSKQGMGLNVETIAVKGTVDNYLISFLNALNYTEGCYNCGFACTQRCSDITLGDNWGTELKEELPKGLSLVLCMTKKGEELIDGSRIELRNVDIEKALSANGQLKHPSYKPLKREEFFNNIKAGANYDKTVFYIYPKQCLKQMVKRIAIKLRLFTPG